MNSVVVKHSELTTDIIYVLTCTCTCKYIYTLCACRSVRSFCMHGRCMVSPTEYLCYISVVFCSIFSVQICWVVSSVPCTYKPLSHGTYMYMQCTCTCGFSLQNRV